MPDSAAPRALPIAGELRSLSRELDKNSSSKRALHATHLGGYLYELGKARIFSKTDLRSVYWHVQLDIPSSVLTTFLTPFGRYRWLRIPFRTSVSAEILQKRLSEALAGLDGCVCITDDIIIHGQTEEAHGMNLANFLNHCLEQGIKLNKGKLEFRLHEISLMGHRISKNGLQPDPNKVQAITKV